MLPLLAILGVLTPCVFGYKCDYNKKSYSTGNGYYINSPNYPRTFPYGIDCNWEIDIPNAESITISCEYFNVKKTEDCERAYLEISEDGETFENSAVFCGTGYLSFTVHSNIFKAHFGSEYRRYKSNNGPLNNLKYYYSPIGFNCKLRYTEVPVVSEGEPEISKEPETSGETSQTSANSTETCECGIKNSGGNGGRIVGGGEATMNEYPWQCMLRTSNGYHYCGCSLINNKYILTASHCVVDSGTGEVTKPEDIIVSLGDHQKYTQDETDKTVHIEVASVISHENYDSEKTDNDIAVLELAKPVQFNEAISPVCLPFSTKGTDMSGLQGTVAGWGTTSSGGEDSEMLMEVDIPMLTTKECEVYLGNYLTDNMICTYEEGKDSCQGDSGGPLISDTSKTDVYYQVGIVSWGIGCGYKNYPGVYTKVENYLDWIVSKTDGNFCKK